MSLANKLENAPSKYRSSHPTNKLTKEIKCNQY
jgi:hypothetical protein